MSFSGAFEPMRLRERRDFEFGRQIGDGSYSTVVLAREIENGKEFAVKILDKRHLVKHDKVKCAGVEKDVLNRLNHPFVVKLFYTFQDNVNLYFVLELAKRGDLLGLLRKAGGRFNTEQARFYSAEIFLAMEYMHKTSILHRDIKPENVLIAGDGHIRIADFGTAKDLMQVPPLSPGDDNATSSRNSFVGTAEYCSPELLNDRLASFESDLWAFGIILFQLVVGKSPFRAGSEYMTFQKILKCEYEVPVYLDVDQNLLDLLRKILVLEPDDRIGADMRYQEIREHPFFAQINWEDLAMFKVPPPHIDLKEDDDDEGDTQSKGSFEYPVNPCADSVDTKQLDFGFNAEKKIEQMSTTDDVTLPSTAEPSIPIYLESSETVSEVTGSPCTTISTIKFTHPKMEGFIPFVPLHDTEVAVYFGKVYRRKGLITKKRYLLLTSNRRLFYIKEKSRPEAIELKFDSPEAATKEGSDVELNISATESKKKKNYIFRLPTGGAQEWRERIMGNPLKEPNATRL